MKQNNIGPNLMLLRLSCGKSQADLGKEINLPEKAVAAVENGKRCVGEKTIYSWANACGYNVSINFSKDGE